MSALGMVLIALAAAVAAVGVLAATHRLPRNHVVGVRTRWTMSRVDTFRRANRAAAPGLLASGGVGLVAGAGALVTSGTATAATLLAVGFVGLVALLGVAGVVGARFAAADEAAETSVAAPSGPCTASGPGSASGLGPVEPDACATACSGSCALCPRAGT